MYAFEVPGSGGGGGGGDGGDGPAVRLLLLRNPWGHGEWRGEWSNGSRARGRRPDVAAAVGEKRPSGDDGKVLMEHGDFMERFASVEIVRVAKGRRHGDPRGRWRR